MPMVGSDAVSLANRSHDIYGLYLYLYDRLDQRRFDVMTRVPV